MKRAIRLTEAARLIGDCGNCVAKRLCTLCPAAISERGDSGMPDGAAFQEVCKNTIANVRTQLEEYTTIMEVGAKTLDALLRSETGDDWLNEVAILLTAEQQKEVEIGMHELDEIV